MLTRTFMMKVSDLKARILQNTMHDGFCLTWTGLVTNKKGMSYGAIKVNIQDIHMTMTVHRAMYLVENPNLFHSEYEIKRIHVSHLCHNSLCVKIDHLHLEPAIINQRRRRCNARKVCYGHRNRPDCIFHW